MSISIASRDSEFQQCLSCILISTWILILIGYVLIYIVNSNINLLPFVQVNFFQRRLSSQIVTVNRVGHCLK